MSIEIIEIGSEEDLREQEEQFKKLKPGKLFTLGGKRYFIAVEKMTNVTTWQVVELTPLNTYRIATGRGEIKTSELDLENMACLHVVQRWDADNVAYAEDL